MSGLDTMRRNPLVALSLFVSLARSTDLHNSAFAFGNAAPLQRRSNLVERRQYGSEFCRVFPGDEDWPTDREWALFNDTVGGALIKPVPRAAVCYSSWPQYDPIKCRDVFNNYNNHEQKYDLPEYSDQ